jgi:hypothetical protein
MWSTLRIARCSHASNQWSHLSNLAVRRQKLQRSPSRPTLPCTTSCLCKSRATHRRAVRYLRVPHPPMTHGNQTLPRLRRHQHRLHHRQVGCLSRVGRFVCGPRGLVEMSWPLYEITHSQPTKVTTSPCRLQRGRQRPRPHSRRDRASTAAWRSWWRARRPTRPTRSR